jgi:hypothetical protein
MKHFALLLVLLLGSLASIAQPQWGFKAGINHNQIKLEKTPFLSNSYFRNNIGFHIGGFGDFSLNRDKKWVLHTGLQFIQRGANSSIYTSSPTQETRVDIYYLEAPILVSRKLFKIFQLELGPSISFKLHATEKPTDDSKNLDRIFINNFDFGLNGGLRVTLYNQISVWGRYYQGLSQTSYFTNVFSNTTFKNTKKNFQFGLGYTIASKKQNSF